MELADLEGARSEATRSVQSLRSDAALDGLNIDHQVIEVVDAEGMIHHTLGLGDLR